MSLSLHVIKELRTISNSENLFGQSIPLFHRVVLKIINKHAREKNISNWVFYWFIKDDQLF